MAFSNPKFGIRSVIIVTPIFIILGFNFSYMQFQTASLRRAAAKTTAASSTSSRPALPLVSQPELPKLNNGSGTDSPSDALESSVPPTQAQSESRSNPSETTVGPSSTHAGSALQPVGQDNGREANHALQATRDSVKIEDLHL